MTVALPDRGAIAHFRALESLYATAPINNLFESRLEIVEAGFARIRFLLDERHFHAAGAVHGTSYFKMLDDAAFYAANSLVSDRFLLTTAFNLLFTKPLKGRRGGRRGPLGQRQTAGVRRRRPADRRRRRGGGARHGHLHALANRAGDAARLPRA